MPEHSGYTARSGLEILGGAQQAKMTPKRAIQAVESSLSFCTAMQ